MSDSAIDIDRIVREVVRRLQALNEPTSPLASPVELRPSTNIHALHLGDRVVTMALVAERLSDIQQLVISHKAIVTPAVRDELCARQITLVREEAPSRQIATAAGRKPRLVVARDESADGSPNSLPLNSWGMNSLQTELVSARDLASQLQQIEDSLQHQAGIRSIGLFVTQRPFVVACEANRRPSLRAAVVGDPQQAIEARETLDANLFVVRPSAPFRLRGVIQAAIGQEPPAPGTKRI
jgi:hypothetical protein